MPSFYVDDVDIDPDEFLSSCNKREVQELIDALVESGDISPAQRDGSAYGVNRPNHNDEKFWESLAQLMKCRDLLSVEEEAYINNLAEKFKYLR
jgi:hypothetical protein